MIVSEMSSLPRGWVRENLAQLIDPRTEKVLPSSLPDLQFIGMDHVEPHTTRILGSVPASSMKSSAARFYQGDVLYGRLRPYLNKVAEPSFDGLASAEFIVLPTNELLDSKFLKYRLSALDFVSFASHLDEGDRPRVGFDQIGVFEVLVPPAKEQRRIVAKLEELFSELDAGIESLKTAREQLKLYRQALLKHAFEGKLTAAWRAENADKFESAEELLERISKDRAERYQQRMAEWKEAVQKWEENGKKGPKPSKAGTTKAIEPPTDLASADTSELPAGWRWSHVGEFFDVYVGATPSRRRSDYWDGEIAWVSSGEVAFCRISETKEKITAAGYSSASTIAHPPGTVMLAMIGEGKTRGQAAILDILAAHNQNTAAIRVSETGCSPEYLYHYLALRYEATRKLGSGNNQKALNKDRVARLRVPICAIEEQREIANLLEEQLSALDVLNQEIHDSLSRAEALRQSILKRAFSGQLVPQDPSDEPASVLLERIRAELASAANANPGGRQRRAPKLAAKR